MHLRTTKRKNQWNLDLLHQRRKSIDENLMALMLWYAVAYKLGG